MNLKKQKKLLIKGENMEETKVLWQRILSCFPNELRLFIHNRAFLAGGWAASLAHNLPPKDYDIFFRTKKDSNTFLEKIGQNYLKKSRWAITIEKNGMKINCVTPVTGSPDQVRESFDFFHTHASYDPLRDVLHRHSAVWGKELLFNEFARTPASSLNRVFKFLNRGYTIDEKNSKLMVKLSLKYVEKHGAKTAYYSPGPLLNLEKL